MVNGIREQSTKTPRSTDRMLFDTHPPTLKNKKQKELINKSWTCTNNKKGKLATEGGKTEHPVTAQVGKLADSVAAS